MNVNNINKLDLHFFKPIFDKKYVDYRRKECPQLYNEIYKYLKTEEKKINITFYEKCRSLLAKKAK